MSGRHSFKIHGDSSVTPSSASQGCIILRPEIRRAIIASTDSWAVQSTLATLRSQGFESEQQLQVVLLSRTLLSGQGKIAPLADYGNLYSQSLSITIRSKSAFPEVKHLLVTSIISDQECSMTQPVILDLDALKP